MTDLFNVSRMPMAFPTRFIRLRASHASNPYNPSQLVLDWQHVSELEFAGMLASSSSTENRDGNDVVVSSSATLTVSDPDLDISVHDRIRADPDDGRLYEVVGFPARDVNPFTGWQPTLEINLVEVRG